MCRLNLSTLTPLQKNTHTSAALAGRKSTVTLCFTVQQSRSIVFQALGIGWLVYYGTQFKAVTVDTFNYVPCQLIRCLR